MFVIEVRAGRIKVFRVNVQRNAFHGGQRRLQSALGCCGGQRVLRMFQLVDLRFGQNTFAQQAHLHLRNRVAQHIGIALGSRTIKLVVVRERMGVGPHAVSVDKGGPKARAAMRGRRLKRVQACLRIRTVHLHKVEVRKILHQV